MNTVCLQQPNSQKHRITWHHSKFTWHSARFRICEYNASTCDARYKSRIKLSYNGQNKTTNSRAIFYNLQITNVNDLVKLLTLWTQRRSWGFRTSEYVVI